MKQLIKEAYQAHLSDERALENQLRKIKEIKAEIERLKNAGDNKTKELLRLNSTIEELHEKIKTATIEAIKEFAERLKVHAYYISFPKEHRVVDEDDIDNLVKEMTE